MKAEFQIEGMHCGSCALDIKETLEELGGVSEADVTFDGKSAVVQFDERVIQPTALAKKIQELGYTATIAEQTKGA